MNLKMIIAFVSDEDTEPIIQAAREAGATGVSVIPGARGEGLEPTRTFLGLELTAKRDLLMFLVAAPRAREIMEKIGEVAHFDEESGGGIAMQIAVEDAVGLKSQAGVLNDEIEGAL